MRKIELYIPENSKELKQLEGKVVIARLEGKVAPGHPYSLLFKVNDESVELAEQTRESNNQNIEYLNSIVIAQISFNDLEYTLEGIIIKKLIEGGVAKPGSDYFEKLYPLLDGKNIWRKPIQL